VDGELVQISRAEDAKQASTVTDLNRRYEVLKKIGQSRGYRHPDTWAFNVICGQESARLAKLRPANSNRSVNGLTDQERRRVWTETLGKASTSR